MTYYLKTFLKQTGRFYNNFLVHGSFSFTLILEIGMSDFAIEIVLSCQWLIYDIPFKFRRLTKLNYVVSTFNSIGRHKISFYNRGVWRRPLVDCNFNWIKTFHFDETNISIDVFNNPYRTGTRVPFPHCP